MSGHVTDHVKFCFQDGVLMLRPKTEAGRMILKQFMYEYKEHGGKMIDVDADEMYEKKKT